MVAFHLVGFQYHNPLVVAAGLQKHSAVAAFDQRQEMAGCIPSNWQVTAVHIPVVAWQGVYSVAWREQKTLVASAVAWIPVVVVERQPVVAAVG